MRNLVFRSEKRDYYRTWRHSTTTSELPDVGAKLDTWRLKTFHNFHFLQSDMVFEFASAFP